MGVSELISNATNAVGLNSQPALKYELWIVGLVCVAITFILFAGGYTYTSKLVAPIAKSLGINQFGSMRYASSGHDDGSVAPPYVVSGLLNGMNPTVAGNQGSMALLASKMAPPGVETMGFRGRRLVSAPTGNVSQGTILSIAQGQI